MPVEVLPGPWSFLANIGQGIANYGEGKAKNRAEAMKQVGTIFDAVQNNQLTASTLKSPFFLDLLKRSGISDQFTVAPENVTAKPSDQLAQGQSEALGQVLPQILNPNATSDQATQARALLASTGKVATPQETAEGVEKTAASELRGRTIAGGGAAARVQAGAVAPDVAVAQETAATEPLYNSIAGRTVDAAITNLKLPKVEAGNVQNISDAAWGLAQSDAASKGFTLNEELTRPYIDAAVQQRLRAQEEADTKRIAAQNAGGAGADPRKYLLDFYQRQQQRVNDAIKTLPKPSLAEQALAGEIDRTAREQNRTVEQVLADPSVPQITKDAYSKVQSYNTQLPSLQREAEGYRDQIGQILGQAVGAEQPYAPPPSAGARSGAPNVSGMQTDFRPPQSTTGQPAPTVDTYRAASRRLQELRAMNKGAQTDAELIDQVNREFGLPPTSTISGR